MDDQIKAVQRMQDYIDEHLYERITSADLARASLYSPWHSCRLFVFLLNISPTSYIRRLRLAKSALALRDTKLRIADVAFEVGFESVDGYQRAFFREFGCNPRNYSANPIPIYLFTPYGIRYTNIEKEDNMNTAKSIFIQVIEKPARKVIIKRGLTASDYFAYCEEVGCDVWGLLKSIKSINNEPVSLWLPKEYIKEGTSKYVQGVEVSLNYDGVIPDGLDVIILPECKYLMFQGEPFAEEDYMEAIKQLWEATKKYNPSAINYMWDSSNPRIQLEPLGARGYIELLAIKELL